MTTPPEDPSFPSSSPMLGRRHLIAGLGALGGGALIGGLPEAAAASIDGTGPDGPGAAGGPGGRAFPISTTMASAPQPGVRYEFRGVFDFVAESVGADLIWSQTGTYATVVDSALWTSFDLPPGAVVHDIEWYVRNSSGSSVYPMARAWTPNSGAMSNAIVDVEVPSGGASLQVRRGLAPATTNGPYPHGCRLFCGLRTVTGGAVRVNGVRVGYRPAAGAVALLPTATRVYDSRSTTPLAPNQTRTIGLAGAIPAGALGAVISLSVTGCVGKGTLRLGPGGATPAATAIQWSRTGDQVTTAANTAIDANRRIAVRSVGSTGNTHVVVDVVGYLR